MSGHRAANPWPSQRTRSDPREDARLIERLRNRDLAAFEQLYRAYHGRLARFVTNLVRRPALVEEIVDDTLMVVWDRPESFRGESRPSTWMFGIAYRKAMKALRRQDEPIEDDRAHLRESPEEDPAAQLGRRLVHDLLVAAMEELSADHRTVVHLTYFQEMSYQEIAEVMSCPVDTVKTRMFHARRRLRRILSGELSDWV